MYIFKKEELGATRSAVKLVSAFVVVSLNGNGAYLYRVVRVTEDCSPCYVAASPAQAESL